MDEPVLRPIEGSFDATLFQPRYQRNNKRGGLKNLRCFPTCAAQHKERGFCGRPVFMKLKTDEGDNLLTWAEFVKSDEPKTINVGHTLSLAQAEAWSRSKDEPLKPWIKGTLASVANGMSVFEFNREKRGWHYGWASNKHTCNANHVLVAWVFERNRSNNDELICKGVIESPAFMLFCRRRRRFTLVPSAPIAEPKSSKSKSQSNGGEDFDGEDDDEDEEEDEEEEEQIEQKKSKSRRKSPPVVKPTKAVSSSASTRKRSRVEIIELPEFPLLLTSSSSAADFSSSSTGTLDKNRVDALLSLLHLAWRKLKDADAGDASFSSEDITSESANPIAAQTDNEFYQMLEFLSGDFDIEGISFDNAASAAAAPSSSSSAAATPSATLIKDDEANAEEAYEVDPDVAALAEYLLKEPDFRQSVLWLRGKGGHPDFNAFIGILRDHIHKFMRMKSWTASDIDRLIQNSSGSGNPPAAKSEANTPWFLDESDKALFTWDLASKVEAERAASPREFMVEACQVPNITGVWKQTKESQVAMEQVREKSGSSWVMSKLFEFMESKFTIHQTGLELSCRLWPMPALRFVLDGEEHPWGIRLPLFQPNWTYRAWTDGKVITLQHQIENRRLTRKYWCDPYRKFLYSEATLEVFDSFESRFVEESRVNQIAERVR